MLITCEKLKCFLFYFISILNSYCCFWNRYFRNKKGYEWSSSPILAFLNQDHKFFSLLHQEVLARVLAVKTLRYSLWDASHTEVVACWRGHLYTIGLMIGTEFRLLPFPMKHHTTGVVWDPPIPAHLLNEYPWVASIKTTWKRRPIHLSAGTLLIHEIMRYNKMIVVLSN